jgi:hypothetical protein
MPTDAGTLSVAPAMHPLAARRILRLALGTALALCFSQVINWPLSYITPVLTLVILGLPLPVMSFKKGLVFILALLVPMILAMGLLPFLQYARWAGILLVALALYYTFYFTAKGGPAALGTFMTIGLTLTVTVGTVNSAVLIVLIESLAKCTVFALAFVWLAHALLPDLPPDPGAQVRSPPVKDKPDLAEARRNALRALVVVLPMALLFMFMSGSPSYTVVMLKVAAMGQQASADHSRKMGRSLLESTLWGGVGALIAWLLMSAWPSLIFYTLLIGLAGLVYGRGIFSGPAVHPKFSMWSYAFLTMIVILAPAVLDSPGGSGAEIWSRLWLFILIALYGTTAVAVFDAFWPSAKLSDQKYAGK